MIDTEPVRRSAAGLAYDRAGTGPPVLLVHGLGSDRLVWSPVVPSLREHFDVIAVDLPGHGKSRRLAPGQSASAVALATQLANLIDELGLDHVHVAGSSLGGWVAIELALQSRATSVTAMAPAGFWRDGLVPLVAHANRWAARAVWPAAGTLLRVQAFRAIGFWTSSAKPSELDARVATHATTSLAHASGWAATLAATYGHRCDASSLPASVPLTVVWGDADRILPASYCQEPGGLPSHARWVRLSDCGHVPMWDQPEQSIRLIEETATSAVRTSRLA